MSTAPALFVPRLERRRRLGALFVAVCLLVTVGVMAILLVLEREWGFHYEASKQIIYEKIELIRPERRAELLADLQERTGLRIRRVQVGKVDFLHDVANVKIYYDDPAQGDWLGNGETVADD